MSPEMKIKRQKLSVVSKKMKQLVEVGAFETVNQALIAMYSNGQDLEFNRFNQWKEKGFIVNKGSKSFPVWGTPKKFAIDKNVNEEEKDFQFFPVCNLFSSIQVTKKENN